MATKPMGIGPIGLPTTDIKRKHRWTFEIQGFCNNQSNIVPEFFLKTAARPNLAVEEVELNHLNAKTWVPGKASWETITVVYYDAINQSTQMLWNWMATVYDFTDPINLRMGVKRDWDATGIINMYDGCGVLLETWQLQHMFPTAVNFGDLDYATSDFAEIELTLRYSDVIYRSFCPNFTIAPCCTGCQS